MNAAKTCPRALFALFCAYQGDGRLHDGGTFDFSLASWLASGTKQKKKRKGARRKKAKNFVSTCAMEVLGFFFLYKKEKVPLPSYSSLITTSFDKARRAGGARYVGLITRELACTYGDAPSPAEKRSEPSAILTIQVLPHWGHWMCSCEAVR